MQPASAHTILCRIFSRVFTQLRFKSMGRLVVGMKANRVARKAHGSGNIKPCVNLVGIRSNRRGGIQHGAEQAQQQAPRPLFAAQSRPNTNCLLGRKVNDDTHGELYRQLWR